MDVICPLPLDDYQEKYRYSPVDSANVQAIHSTFGGIAALCVFPGSDGLGRDKYAGQ